MTKKQLSSQKKTKSGAANPLFFAIERIELTQKNLTDYFPKSGDDVVLRISIDVTSNLINSLLSISIKCTYLLDDKTEIFSFTVVSEYHIPNLKLFIVNKKFTEGNMLEYLADLSLNHTRGFQASIINDTGFKKLFVPVADLSQIRNETIN